MVVKDYVGPLRIERMILSFAIDKPVPFPYTEGVAADHPEFTIREAKAEDASRIAELGAEVFLTSHQFPHEPGVTEAYTKEHFGAEKILNDLNKDTVYYYVAVADSIVGFVKFISCQWTPRFPGKITFEVKHLYIQPGMEGKGIGSRLMALAVDAGRRKNYKIIWLSVWENNTRAIRFHQRHGFEVIGEGEFSLGSARRKYLVMRLT